MPAADSLLDVLLMLPVASRVKFYPALFGGQQQLCVFQFGGMAERLHGVRLQTLEEAGARVEMLRVIAGLPET